MTINSVSYAIQHGSSETLRVADENGWYVVRETWERARLVNVQIESKQATEPEARAALKEIQSIMTLPDAATYACVAYATMAEAVREGRVVARRVGGGKRGTYLTTRAAVDQAVAEGKLRPRK